MKRMMKHVGIIGILLCMFWCVSPVIHAEAEEKWYTLDGVVGGQIEFDSETGSITDCETTVTEADIPAEIDGVAVKSISSLTFEDCSSLTSVTIPDGVTSIGLCVFYGCDSLSKVIIPNSVTSMAVSESISSYGYYNWGVFSECTSTNLKSTGPIGSGCDIEFGWTKTIPKGAFYECSSLTSVIIPDGVTSIGYVAFGECSNLSSIIIPGSVTSMGVGSTLYASKNYGVFSGYQSNDLTSAGPVGSGCDIEFGWTEAIPRGAFYDCRELTSVSIPEGATNIGSEAFSGCTGLTEIDIPATVKTIGEGAFSGCTALKTAGPIDSGCSIEYGWTEELPENTFSGLTSLEMVLFPDTMKKIGASAFSGCSKLENVYLPTGLEEIGTAAFTSCTSLKELKLPKGLSEIADETFKGCTALTGIALPDEVTKIGDNAFYGCTVLSDIDLSDGLTDIGKSAFQKCSQLVSVNLPMNLINIGDFAFADCGGLTNMILPNKVETIGESAFSKCTGLTGMTMSNSLKSIGASAFSQCSNLSTLVLPKTVNSIGVSAFSGCTKLTSINIPAGITEVPDGAFYGCAKLKNVVLPEGVTAIGKQAFYGCSSLEYAIIPDGVITIGEAAFRDCTGMKDAEIPRTVTSLGSNVFYNCDGLTKVTIPKTLTQVPDNAFCDCDNLKSLVIEEGLTSIGYSAFDSCNNLEKVVLPKTLENVGNYAFYGCSKLTTAGPLGSDCRIEYSWTEEIPFWISNVTPQTLVIGVDMTAVTSKMNTPTRLEIYNPNFTDFAFVEDDSYKTLKTIAGFAGSKVEIYARNKGYTFEVLHETVLDAGETASCTEYGLLDAWYCEECELNYTEPYHKNVLSDAERIVLPTHQTTVFTKEKKPTCTEDGNDQYWYCEDCEKYFADENFTYEISLKETVIMKTGHSWNSYYTVDVPATEVKEGSQSIYCGICDTKKSGSTVPILMGGTIGQADHYDLTQAKISWNHTDYVFSGAEIFAEPVVSVGKTILEKDKDYRLTYKNNVNVGDEAIVKVIGKGYYEGELEAFFTILPKNLSGASLEITNTVYQNGYVNPKVKVYLNGSYLVAGTDYDCYFRNHHAIGTATVVIVGKGNYAGILSRDFQIRGTSVQPVTAYLRGGADTMNVISGADVTCVGSSTGSSYWYECVLKKDGRVLKTSRSTESKLGPNLTFSTSSYGTGTYTVEYDIYDYYSESETKLINSGGSYVYRTYTTYYRSSYIGTGTYTFYVSSGSTVEKEQVTELEILEPVIVDSKTIFLNVEATPEDGDLSELTWKSSDERVAEVLEGVVTLKKAGKAVITASANGVKATCDLEIDAIDLSYAEIIGIDAESGAPIVTLNGELLRYGTDYICENVDFGNEVQLLKVKGCNLYTGALETAIYKETLMPVADHQLFWAIDDGKLLLYVNGEMKDLESANEVPWNAKTITEVEFYGNIEKVGDYIFSNCSKLKSITFEGDAPEFGEKAFAGSELIIYYPEDKEGWTDEVKKNYGGKLTWLHPGETPTPEPTEEITPTPTEEITPTPTEEVTPTPTEEVTPTPTEEVTPAPTEEVTPSPTSVPESKEDVTKVFSDVYNDWYKSYVQYVYDNSLMTGIKGTTRFEPNTNITKAQVAQVLYNMENQPALSDRSVFTDLKDVYTYEWYANAVAWAYNTGVVTGDTNAKKFFPNADVTREQLALMMYRYAKYKEYDTSQTSNLADLKNAENTANWALDGVKWAVGTGLVSGIEKNGVKDLAPQGNATRAQVAAILQRFCEFYER